MPGEKYPAKRKFKGDLEHIEVETKLQFFTCKKYSSKTCQSTFYEIQLWGKVFLVVRDYTDHYYHQIKRLALTRCVEDPFVLISSENVFNGATSGWSLGHACDLVLKKCMYVNQWNFRKICILPFQISFVKRDGYILKSHTILTIFLE